MPARKPPTPTKSSESVASRILAKLLRAPESDTIEQVITDYMDTAEPSPMRLVLQDVHALYPWVTNVAQDIMHRETTPLTEHLMSLPNQWHVVRDNAFSGATSLWLAVGDPADASVLSQHPHRGLMQTFQIDEADTCQVIAIQLSSCRL